MEIQNVIDIYEITNWYDKEDNPEFLVDPYLIQCAINRDVYPSADDVIKDDGTPIKRKVTVYVTIENV